MNSAVTSCELCSTVGGVELLRAPAWRIVRVEDPYYPGFCRVILNKHVREMSELPVIERQLLMSVVFVVETAIRTLFKPDKINLASFGNMVPHVHWHVIPRWTNDRHFPEPVWGNIHSEIPVQRVTVSNDLLTATLISILNEHAIDFGAV